MRKTISLSIILFAIISCQEKLTVFKPVVKINDAYQYSTKDALCSEFQDNIIFVLSYYSEEFRSQNDSILITSKLFNDKELLYNYTKKACDSDWLKDKNIK
jgi:hypothetical protein